jgi:CBS domain-containing protein
MPRLSLTSHPILRLHVLPAGTGRDKVFCRLRRSSVSVEECAACPRCDGITATVDCTIAIPEEHRAPDPDGDRTEVGTLLCTGATVIAQSASLGEALRYLREEDRRSLGVVNDDQRLVGVVHELAAFGPSGDLTVNGAMSSAIAIHEATPVRTALRLLASAHLREATVVCPDGRPLGVFRDIDGLRFIAQGRRARALLSDDLHA